MAIKFVPPKDNTPKPPKLGSAEEILNLPFDPLPEGGAGLAKGELITKIVSGSGKTLIGGGGGGSAGITSNTVLLQQEMSSGKVIGAMAKLAGDINGEIANILAAKMAQDIDNQVLASLNQGTELSALIDHVIVGLRNVDVLKAELKKAEAEYLAVAQPLLDSLEELIPADQELLLQGSKENLSIGAKGMKATVKDKGLLMKILGESYFELAEVGIGKIREYLSPPEQAKVLLEERVNKRIVKRVKK